MEEAVVLPLYMPEYFTGIRRPWKVGREGEGRGRDGRGKWRGRRCVHSLALQCVAPVSQIDRLSAMKI